MSSYSIFLDCADELPLTHTLFVRWAAVDRHGICTLPTHFHRTSVLQLGEIFQLFSVLTEVIKYEFQYYSIINYLSTAFIFIVVVFDAGCLAIIRQFLASTFCGVWLASWRKGNVRSSSSNFRVFSFFAILVFFSIQRSKCMYNNKLHITNNEWLSK